MSHGANARPGPPDRTADIRLSTLFSSKRIEVGQGTFLIGRDPDLQMTATLGSCVAVVLHDAIGHVGGMTHIFQCVDPGPTGGAAVIAEIEKLVNALMRAGVPRCGLDASVVGGAHTLARGRDVGKEIGVVCLDFLDAERILLRTSDLGGNRPRRITFRPASGLLDIAYPGHALPTGLPPKSTRSGGETELF